MPLKNKEENNTQEKSKEKSVGRLSNYKLMIFLVIAVLIGGGVMIGILSYTGVFNQDGSAAEGGSKSKSVSTETLNLGSMVINLADPGGNRYVKINTVMEYPKDKKLYEEVKEKEHQISEAVLLTFRSKTVAEIQPLHRLDAVKEELLNSVNGRLEHGKIQQVYFTEFIIH